MTNLVVNLMHLLLVVFGCYACYQLCMLAAALHDKKEAGAGKRRPPIEALATAWLLSVVAAMIAISEGVWALVRFADATPIPPRLVEAVITGRLPHFVTIVAALMFIRSQVKTWQHPTE